MTNERIFTELKKVISETLVHLEVEVELSEMLVPSEVEVETSKPNVTYSSYNAKPPHLRRVVALNNLLHF